MKKKIIIIVLAIGLVGSSLYIQQVHAFNLGKAIRKGLKKAGKAIKKGFDGAGDQIKKAFQKFGKDIKNIGENVIDGVEDIGETTWNKIKNFPDCLDVVKYGTEWASLRGSYEASKASIKATEESLKFFGNAAKTLGKISAAALKKGINIKEFEFNASVAELIKIKTPEFKIKAVAFGKTINVDAQIDLSSKGKLIKNLVDEIVDKIKP